MSREIQYVNSTGVLDEMHVLWITCSIYNLQVVYHGSRQIVVIGRQAVVLERVVVRCFVVVQLLPRLVVGAHFLCCHVEHHFERSRYHAEPTYRNIL